jgi:hypothetical protein
MDRFSRPRVDDLVDDDIRTDSGEIATALELDEDIDESPANLELRRLVALASRPTTLGETGLSLTFIAELVAKHLATAGVLTGSQLIDRVALAGPILEQVLSFLRADGRIEVLARAANSNDLRYGLTDKGRLGARDALERGGYVGRAPVPIEQYCALIEKQSVHARGVTRNAVHAAFRGLHVDEAVLDRLGPALNSRRAILIYGAAGTGKTWTARRLADAINGLVLIPRAVLVNDVVVEVFDPLVHEPLEFMDPPSPTLLGAGFDPRYVACERPVVMTGGELCADMLEVRYDGNTRCYMAPLQLKASNGFLLIDDLGRQRIEPATLFNRWIVPLESRRDWLTLGSGHHFEVPFDVILVFSTNLTPSDVADDAFLRRLGYKVGFEPIKPSQYRSIWAAVMRERGLIDDPTLADFAIRELHQPQHVPLLPCHPRDLIGIACDRAAYLGTSKIDGPAIRWAWSNYFAGEQAPNGARGTSGASDSGTSRGVHR